MSHIEYLWTIRGSLHMGTGMSRLGEVDRIIRVNSKRQAIIEGEQVKGAVRGAAERLARWLGAVLPDNATTSYPAHPVLERLFAPHREALVRFEPARIDAQNETDIARLASTAIDHGRGAAVDHTLRIVEALSRGARFKGNVSLYGDWTTETARRDIEFLCCALLSTDAIGSRKGTGYGQIEVSLQCDSVEVSQLATAATVERLRAHVKEPAA